MEILGIATPEVEILSSLPNVGAVTKINFDVSAANWPTIQNSPFFSPLLTEAVIDPAGTLTALHPSKRIYWVDNYLDGGTAEESATDEEPYITWTPIGTPEASQIMEAIVTKQNFDTYSLLEPGEDAAEGYLGPKWTDNAQNQESLPNDRQIIEDFISWVSGEASEPDAPEDTDAATPIVDINYIFQQEVRDGLWWGVESSSFLKENTPFWVTVKRMQPPTTSENRDTVLVISLGLSDASNRFDILLSLNSKPRIIDYYEGGEGSAPNIQKEFMAEGSTILSSMTDLKIGVMTVAGRLVVFVNGETLVYTRVDKEEGDDGGKLLECKIAEGAIKIYGTNAQCYINVSPMSFAELGAIAVPVPVISSGTGEGEVETSYQGVKYDGSAGDSVCHLPTPPSAREQVFGCDCNEFSGDGGSASPSGFGFHKQGSIKFNKASETSFAALPSTEFYTLAFWPEETDWGEGTIPNGGCPYYFRLKGLVVKEGEVGSGGSADITDSVITISETATAPDYFHCKKSATITCYDENGGISSSLVSGQSGVQISWGWDGSNTKTFTGVVSSVSLGQKAGRETVTINADDYMYILKKNPILNSPFYDGMVAYYAIKDLAERGSISGFINDWTSTDDYFLPQGYAFTKPRMRYPSQQSIFDCMMDIVKRHEAFLYFDEDGKLVITKLPGGLFSSSGGSGSSGSSFVSDPTASVGTVILDEKQVDISYESTVNVIVAMTVERDTRNPIIYMKKASGGENNLAFRKVSVLRQAALGELEVCRGYVDELAERVFYPVLKSRWKTAGAGVDVIPLEFVTVDSQQFRVMSVKRNFNADTNDLTTNYEGEWLGGSV